MPCNTTAQKRFSQTPCIEQLFPPAFYQPYRIAVQTAFSMLCHTRKLLSGDLGEETVQRMTFRLKTPQSISDKLRKKKLPVTCDAAATALHDIAGLRVVFSNVNAVYRFAALLTASPLAEFISCRDYIAQPKPSGYQSLHLLMVVPVIDQGQHLLVPIEIQLRTSQMDAWAVIDHEACYKPRSGLDPDGSAGLPPKPVKGLLPPHSTRIGQDAPDCPLACHSLLPQFGDIHSLDSPRFALF